MADTAAVRKIIDHVQPLPGHIAPIKTVQQIRAPEEFGMCLLIDSLRNTDSRR